MPRKYEVVTCSGCGGQFGAIDTCTCETSHAKTGKVVTAVDLRDVEPLLEAVRPLAARAPQTPFTGNPFAMVPADELRALLPALKAFEEDS